MPKWVVWGRGSDGDCFFDSFAASLMNHRYGCCPTVAQCKKLSWFLRCLCVDWTKRNLEKEFHGMKLKDYIEDEDAEKYCERMKRKGEWGGHVDIMGLSNTCNVTVVIFDTRLNKMETCTPITGAKRQTVNLVWQPGHYSVLLRVK